MEIYDTYSVQGTHTIQLRMRVQFLQHQSLGAVAHLVPNWVM
jgi:hypothetical protein